MAEVPDRRYRPQHDASDVLLFTWNKVKELFSNSLKRTQISSVLGLHRQTVSKYLSMSEEEFCSFQSYDRHYGHKLDAYEQFVVNGQGTGIASHKQGARGACEQLIAATRQDLFDGLDLEIRNTKLKLYSIKREIIPVLWLIIWSPDYNSLILQQNNPYDQTYWTRQGIH